MTPSNSTVEISNVPGSVDDISSLLTIAKSNFVNLVVVGPEIPLVKGITNEMTKAVSMLIHLSAHSVLNMPIWYREFPALVHLQKLLK